MNILKRLFSCPKGYHSVGTDVFDEPHEFTTVEQDGEKITYFRCEHCREFLFVLGEVEAVKTVPALPMKNIEPFSTPEHVKEALKEATWFINVKPERKPWTGGAYHGGELSAHDRVFMILPHTRGTAG
jgi:hypothetical protein